MHNNPVVFRIKTDLPIGDVRVERLQEFHHFIPGIDLDTANSELGTDKNSCKVRFRFGPSIRNSIQVTAKVKPVVGTDLYEVEASGETVDLTAFCQSNYGKTKPNKLIRPMFGDSLKKEAKRHGAKDPIVNVALPTPAPQPHMTEVSEKATSTLA